MAPKEQNSFESEDSQSENDSSSPESVLKSSTRITWRKKTTNRKNKKPHQNSLSPEPSSSGANEIYDRNELKRKNLELNEEHTEKKAKFEDSELKSISDLNPFQTKWILKVRAINKRPIYNWKNEKSSGKLFSLDLIDKTGTIRITAFNECVNKFYDKIADEKIYLISNAELKEANLKYNNTGNNFELTFTNDTELIQCEEEDESIPKMIYEFTPISKLKEKEKDSSVNVIGICYDVKSLEEFTAKSSGKFMKKREILVIDKSNEIIQFVLWNSDAESYDSSYLRSVITIINGRLNEYKNMYSISKTRETIVQFNSETDESRALKKWFEGKNNKLMPKIIATGIKSFFRFKNNYVLLIYTHVSFF